MGKASLAGRISHRVFQPGDSRIQAVTAGRVPVYPQRRDTRTPAVAELIPEQMVDGGCIRDGATGGFPRRQRG